MLYSFIQPCNKKELAPDWTSVANSLEAIRKLPLYYFNKLGCFSQRKGGSNIRLTKQEKETHISFDEESEYVVISTFNKQLGKKIIKYSSTYPNYMKNVHIGDNGEVSCEVIKDRLTIRFKPVRTLSEADKKKLTNNFKKKHQELGKK